MGMNVMKIKVCVLFLFLSLPLSAQHVAVKTNLLYDATATFNLAVELGLAPRWTMDLSANYNPFTFSDNKKWKHWMAQPEFRYWFCERFNGHFLGMHLLGGQFNVGNVKFPLGIYPSTKGSRYEGYYYGVGLAYGYHWVLGNHWSIEASLGLGYIGADYDHYDCVTCGEWKGNEHKNYLGVTKAAVSLIYVIK